MSIKLIDRVFEDQTLKPTKKLIMLSMADNANDEGVCYPKLETIMRKTGLGRTAVVKNLADLEDEEKLQKTYRAQREGGRYSNIYLLYPLENYDRLDAAFDKYFHEPISRQSSPDGTENAESQSSPDGTETPSQSSPDGTDLTICEPSLKNKPSLKSGGFGLKIAKYLEKNIKKFKPNFKTKNIDIWAHDINLAMEIDNRTEKELRGCIDWIHNTQDGEFWKSNILSGKKLREKFDQMEAQMMRSQSNNGKVIANYKKIQEIRDAAN